MPKSAKVMSIQPRPVNSLASTTEPAPGLVIDEVGEATYSVSVSAALTLPPRSAKRPARKVTVYVPAASVAVKLKR